MSGRRHAWPVPAFLLACLILGGSSVTLWPSLLLQLLGLLLIAGAAVSQRAEPRPASVALLGALVIAAFLLVLVQLIPLPPGLWTLLPGRDVIEAGYRYLGLGQVWQPLSWAPYGTLSSAYALVPPLAIIAGIIGLRAYGERWIAVTIIAGALATILLGALQLASSGPEAWPYLYKVTNPGAVGFFANRNHMATLLLVAVPFTTALFALGYPHVRGRARNVALAAIGVGSFVLIAVGLMLNSSLAALLLAAPVLVFSALILPIGWRFRRVLVPVSGIAFVVSIGALATTAIRSDIAASPEYGSLYSRGHIWAETIDAIGDTFPAGTGLGTFRGVYALQEVPAEVDSTFVNHAHNDYLELVLETGLPGLLLLIAFLAWYVVQSVGVWSSPLSSHFAKAATIASAAILAHSVVDYPLRTTAIAALFATCIALIAQASRQGRNQEARHIRIA